MTRSNGTLPGPLWALRRLLRAGIEHLFILSKAVVRLRDVELHARLIHFREHLHQKIDPPFLT